MQSSAALTRKRALVLGALITLLVLGTVVIPPAVQHQPELSSYSTEPNGGRALYLWLDALGSPVATVEGRPWKLPPTTSRLLVLAPDERFLRAELVDLQRWVREGGTLIVAEEGAVGPFLRAFGLGLNVQLERQSRAYPAPGAGLDPAIEEVQIDSRSWLDLRATGAQPLLVDGERVFAARLPYGSGALIALAAPRALSNLALRSEGNARFAFALVQPRPGLQVGFDELHHGYGARPQKDPASLLIDYAWGQAGLLAGALGLVWLLLSGRRFGRPVPLVVSRGRSLAGYVSSMAGLYRVGRKREFIAGHFRHQLRRELARQLGLPGDAADELLAQRASQRGPRLAAAVERLPRLDRAGELGEQELIELVRAIETDLQAALPSRAARHRGTSSGSVSA
jgi:hypothetical protein